MEPLSKLRKLRRFILTSKLLGALSLLANPCLDIWIVLRPLLLTTFGQIESPNCYMAGFELPSVWSKWLKFALVFVIRCVLVLFLRSIFSIWKPPLSLRLVGVIPFIPVPLIRVYYCCDEMPRLMIFFGEWIGGSIKACEAFCDYLFIKSF